MRNQIVVIALMAVALASSTWGQSPGSPGSRLAFDVISVKPNKVGGGCGNEPRSARPVSRDQRDAEASDFVGVPSVQEFVGGPDWINTAHFDIEARSDSSPTPDQMRETLRTMLGPRRGGSL
jgi:uncharacterized protein (TIGR03435 family)